MSSLHYSYLVSRESYLAKIIEAKVQNKFVSSIEYRVYSEEDKMWVISAGWRIVIADSENSIALRKRKKIN